MSTNTKRACKVCTWIAAPFVALRDWICGDADDTEDRAERMADDQEFDHRA